jgi:hypothetical protein
MNLGHLILAPSVWMVDGCQIGPRKGQPAIFAKTTPCPSLPGEVGARPLSEGRQASAPWAPAFEEARRKINAIDEPVEWYFTLAAETPVAVAPGDTGTPVAKAWTIAMPLIGFYPPEREGAPPSPPTHYDVLLPSGRTGWVPVTAVRPLKTDHLCYARTSAGEWKIAAFDQAERAPCQRPGGRECCD